MYDERTDLTDAGVLRQATPDDTDLLVDVVVRGFFDDPVMKWIQPDDEVRRIELPVMFDGFVRDYFPDRGTVHLLASASASFWRSPDFDHWNPGGDDADAAGPSGENTEEEPTEEPSPYVFADDVLARMAAMGAAMHAAHPREPHWYLNVVSTVPEQQGRGLGQQVLAPVLANCDAEGWPAYLESSNPQNVSLYVRLGFVVTGEIELPEGPSMIPMWREPRPLGLR